MKLREQYLKDLRKGLEKAKYKDVDAIIEKYQKRFDLAEEAGFKDEESIEKFGSVEDVVESLTGATIIEKSNLSIKEEHKGQSINFKVDLINDDLEIEVGDYDDFEINYKNTEKDRYRVINDNKVIVYTTKDYYLVLDYKIDKDKMFIYKNTQNKIDNLNVNSKFIKVKEHVIINN